MVKSIIIYEPDLNNMRVKVNNLCNLFTIIRSYSNKMYSHMQIISRLVNDLIDSEENLEIKYSKI